MGGVGGDVIDVWTIEDMLGKCVCVCICVYVYVYVYVCACLYTLCASKCWGCPFLSFLSLSRSLSG